MKSPPLEKVQRPDAANAPVIAQPTATCTCPSGDGSLRWPCPAHQPQLAAPKGSKLVPLESTPAMVQAGQDAGKNCAWSYEACYRAMLAAAPVIAQPKIERGIVTEREAAPADWDECQRISDLPDVNDVLRGFSEDPTGDNATCVVRAILATKRAAEGEAMTAATRDVLAERRRQVEQEGMSTDGDDGYHAAELPRAAAAYILNGANDEAPYIWPFAKSWWKPQHARANYVRAGALILAEIERMDRLYATQQTSAQKGGEA